MILQGLITDQLQKLTVSEVEAEHKMAYWELRLSLKNYRYPPGAKLTVVYKTMRSHDFWIDELSHKDLEKKVERLKEAGKTSAVYITLKSKANTD